MGRIRKIGSAHLQLFTNLISVFNIYTKLETVSGFHFYSYWSCLLASVLYMSSLVFIFPNITLPLYMQIFLLSISFCICYLIGPVLSKYRINFPKKQLYFCRNVTCSIIFLFSLILYIIPQNRYMVAGSWMIILHSLQLLAAKILAKGGRINDI